MGLLSGFIAGEGEDLCKLDTILGLSHINPHFYSFYSCLPWYSIFSPKSFWLWVKTISLGSVRREMQGFTCRLIVEKGDKDPSWPPHEPVGIEQGRFKGILGENVKRKTQS